MGAGQSTVTCNFSAAASNGDTCQSFAAAWGLTVDGFESLNPGVACPNLVAGQSYCVIGTVTTVTPTSTLATTTSPPITVSTTPPTTTPHTTLVTSTTTTSSSPFQPTQLGLAANCNNFHLVASGDTCLVIEGEYGITASQFSTWNPAIDAQCDNLFLGYYVCVGVPGSATSPPTSGPTPQMPGIVSNCKSFHLVQSGDNCFNIDNAVGITLAQFLSWNKDVDANCDNLWLGYYVCVGA
ncbi:hypothetical protein QBC46DRAFT_325534 [Diplogelasinospora grovesii]|uniref:LysM domain-containing protein n=1 Tax=Diplogelasinospora grovesii TaxID=303347 RepID=A0AAN6MVE3_9PEZI|nr:hypothetical protein QBC46DRAFT_325534 [Diplogelasinospora grovesii]